MKIKSITLQKIAVVCGGLGLFFGLGFAGNFETTGETNTGTFMVSLGFLLLAVLLARVSFAVQDMEEKQRKIHKAQKGTVKKPSTKRKAG